MTPARRRAALIIHEGAEADMDGAVDWYAAQRAGLGLKFIQALDACLRQVRRWPQARRVVFEDLDPPVRRALLHRFPYAIYYVAIPGAVHVLGCLNQHRDPDELRAQVKHRVRDG